MKTQDEKKRLLKNTGLIAIGNFGAKMISFLLLPLYTSILTTEEYGTYDFIVAVSTFLLPVVTASMHEAMFRFIIDTGNKGEEFKKVISNAFFAVMTGIMFLGSLFVVISGKLNIQYLHYIWLYVAASSLYTFSNNLLRGLGKIKEYAFISSGKNIVQLILNVIVIAGLRLGIKGLLASMCISEILAFIIVTVISKFWHQIGFKYISLNKLKSMLKYSLPLIPNTLSASVINISDRLVISTYMGPSANGIYSISYKFPNIVETIYHYFYTAWSESASRVFARGKEEAEKYYRSLYNLISNMMFSAILFLTAGMPIMFRLFIKGDYINGFAYVPLLMFAMYFDCIAKFYSGLFTALKKTDVMATSTVIAAIVNIVINIVLIKKIGLYAAAGSTFAADAVLAIMRRLFVSRDISIPLNYGSVISKILMLAVTFVLYSYDNWLKIFLLLGVVFAYTVTVNKQVLLAIFKRYIN